MGELLIYETGEGATGVTVRMDGETVWLTQRQMGELFDTTPENVLMHLKNIFADGELDEPATAKDFSAVQIEGKRQVRRHLKHYNLDAIISVGYRVNSKRGVLFYAQARAAIDELKSALFARGEATDLIGRERGEAIQGILGGTVQAMFGEALYKSHEEKAANLPYFVIRPPVFRRRQAHRFLPVSALSATGGHGDEHQRKCADRSGPAGG